jgi:hypothetical protein
MRPSQICIAAAVSMLNASGRALGPLGRRMPDLTPESLRLRAQRRGGLTEFGSWPIDEPLARLMEAYEREANLTMLGRLTVRELIVSLLENLLYLEQEREASPRVERQAIARPVFIVGLPRTGTTLLHGLIAQDPANRTPLTWEVMYPAGFDETEVGLRRVKRRTAARLAWADRLVPGLKRAHPIGPELPQECVALMAQAFASPEFHTIYRVPSYQDWYERHGQELAFDMHYRMLQQLQARRGTQRWVLKAPAHLFGLMPLVNRYPDARLIHTHRDPLRVLPSIASLNTLLRRAFSHDADPLEIAADWCVRWARALEAFLAARDRSPPERFLDIHYEAIVGSPLETIERIYEFLGWRLSDTARETMTTFLARNPKNKHGAHRYSLAEFGLDRETERKRYTEYCERFQIPLSDA